MSAPRVHRLPVHGVHAVTATVSHHRGGASVPFVAVDITVAGDIGLKLFLDASRAAYADRLVAAISAALAEPAVEVEQVAA